MTSTAARPTPVPAPGISASVSDLVGGTPLLRVGLPGLPAGVQLLAKLEMFNPSASVKDRAALYMLRQAERAGVLGPAGGTVVEASSGNTGISLAALCAVRGHRCVVVMPDNATSERRKLLRAFGAEIVLTRHQDGLLGTIARAQEVQRSIPGSWLVGQEKNPANIAAHYETTGPEIWAATGGDVDVLVCGVGTGGTLTGVARYLKERRDVHVVAVEPAGSPVLSGGPPGPHRIPGLGGGYVAPTTDVGCIDEVIAVSDVDAAAAARQVATSVGLLVGISAGAAADASRVVLSRDRWAGCTAVAVFPDTGERYLSIWDTAADQTATAAPGAPSSPAPRRSPAP
jgi:cysteine synthase A